MKTTVSFSFVVIAIAFLNQASAAAINRCDCVGIVTQHMEDYGDYLDLPADYGVPDYMMQSTPEAIAEFVCAHHPPAGLDYAALLGC